MDKQRYIQVVIVGAVLIGLVAGYLFAQMRPRHDRTKGKASVLVLACIDPRYTNDLAWYLTHNEELHADYDLFCLAGASLGVTQHTHAGWKDTFFDHVQLALDLHGIEEIWCFDHLDCGMYKATLGLDKDDDPKVHSHHMDELASLIKSKHPQLRFKKYMIEVDGAINPM